MSDSRLSIRIDHSTGRFGPGKAALLDAIEAEGSISAAARRLGMSYARAWSLTEQMNGAFAERLVETYAGGNQRGGARLTDTGRRVRALYRKVERRAREAVSGELRALEKLIRP